MLKGGKMKKKILCLASILCLTIAVSSQAAVSNYYYNGSKKVKNTKGAYKAYYNNLLVTGSNNEPAVNINDNIMIPYKQALISKGPKLKGSYSNNTVTLYNSKVKVVMKLDDIYATVNGKRVKLNTPAKKVKYNGHKAIYVPAKKIASFFSFSYQYKKSSKSIYMKHVHTWPSYTISKKATCTQTGLQYRTCTTCGLKQTSTIAQTPHQWDTGVVSGENITYTCKVCKASRTEKNKTQAKTFKTMTERQFIDAVGKMARDYYLKNNKVGVLPSITIAQAIQESGWGKSDLAQGGNNIFGMKKNLSGNNWAGSTWDGKSIFTKKSYENYGGKRVLVKSDFRKYDSIEANIADHAIYLARAKKEDGSLRYPAMSKDNQTVTSQLKSLVSGGYCTFGTYTNNLNKHISNYNLTAFDK